MTPEKFKSLRKQLGYSQHELAVEWSMGKNGDRTIRRWEAGDVPVNPIAAYAITLMSRDNLSSSKQGSNTPN